MRSLVKWLMLTAVGLGLAARAGSPVRVFAHRDDPRRHPDYARRHVKPPDPDLLGHRTHFTSLRWMGWKSYKPLLKQFVDDDRLGDFIWANFDMLDLPTEEFAARVAELKRRNLFLFDIWGFIPGSSSGQGGRTMRLSDEKRQILESVLGDHWLGMDNGEYDGNWVHGWAPAVVPLGGDRFARRLEFQRFFERYNKVLGNRMCTLTSLTFGHYFLQEGCYAMIGSEAAQCLPNAQVFYAFDRGAGKQYGVPWMAGISIFNRWGWKRYFEDWRTLPTGKYGAGATKGTSLALLKKLLFAQLFYNSSVIGLEGSHYREEKGRDVLSPIGRLQRSVMDWCEKNGDPGTMHVPIALLFDVNQGWTVPRHQYAHEVFRVWGTLPYDAGDHFADGVMSMLYPGYEDSGFYHDERGFSAPTPFGDAVDCILSDADAWQLKRYAVVVLAGRLTPSAEFADVLRRYLSDGGKLVATRGNAQALFPAGLPQGDVVVLPGPEWGVAEKPQCALPVKFFPCVDKPLARPYPLAPETRAALADVFAGTRLFAASDDDAAHGLSLVTCRRGKGDYTLCVANNTWREQPLRIRSFAGDVLSCAELPTDGAERGQLGYAYDGATNLVLGADSADRIAGGAVRLFRVKTDESGTVEEIPAPEPPANASRNVFYARGGTPVKEQILARPGFFRHYGGVMVDWTYLDARDREQLQRERNWFDLQGLELLVDLSSGLDLFPNLRLSDNDATEKARTEKTLDALLSKMSALGAKDLLVALHQPPELGMPKETAWTNQCQGLRRLCGDAAKLGITVHLRQSPRRLTPTVPALTNSLADVNTPNLKAAPSLAAFLMPNIRSVAVPRAEALPDESLWLLATPGLDEHGQLYSLHEPLVAHSDADGALTNTLKALTAGKKTRFVFDAIYADRDCEWQDLRLLKDVQDGLIQPNGPVSGR